LAILAASILCNGRVAMNTSHFTLESNSPDGLWGTTWSFLILDGRLVVDKYERWRKSGGNKPKSEACWYRISPHESTITKAEVPFTPAIGTWAKAQWLKHLEYTVTVGFLD